MAEINDWQPVNTANDWQPVSGGAAKPEDKGNSPGLMERLKMGFMDPVYGAAQIGARMGPADAGEAAYFSPEEHEKLVKSVDEQVKSREFAYSSRRKNDSIDWARIAGSVANPLNYVGMFTGGLPGAAIGGAMAGALQPATSDNFTKEKTQQTLMGAAFGTAATGAMSAAGKAVSPIISRAAAELMKQGVALTPGQIAGGIIRRAEEAAKSIPILGSFIRNAEGRSIETFNTSIGNQVLEPIGEQLPRTLEAGRDTISYVNARLSDSYDNLLPQMRFFMDPQFVTDIQNLRTLAGELPHPQAQQFETILQNRVAHRLSPTGNMDGRTLKDVESELNALASSYRGSSIASERQLGIALDEIRFSMRSALMRQNPNQAAELQRINSAYAMFTRMQGAAARRAGGQGIFTPMDLLSAIRSGDKSVRKGDFARGDALMQEYAEFGQFLLPGKMPDSGTPERAMWDMLGLGFIVTQAPKIAAGVLPYTRPGGQAIRAYAQPGPIRQTVRRSLEELSRPVSPAAATAVNEGTRRDMPTPGATMNGYRFKGGDPSQQASWEPM